MPCYVERIKPPSREEYEQWKQFGYLGTWDQYSAAKSSEIGGTMFICGDLGDHCADCMALGEFLCDYPVGDGKTCDRPICGDHAHEIGHEIHYCVGHYQMWLQFKNKGGVDTALKNVIAFKKEK